MSLRCLGTGGNRERLDLVDSSPLSLPTGGWTVSCMFFPDSGVGANTFPWLYGHGSTTSSQHGCNIFVETSTAKVRIIVTDGFGVQWDFSSSNTINVNAWNHVAVVYPGAPAQTMRIHLNGVETSEPNGFELITLNPTGNARIGDATHGGGREWNGRICHPSKWDRGFSSSDASHFTSLLISPAFAQTDHIWHVPLWNATNHFDQLGAISTTPVGALYGKHAPAEYPADEMYVLPVKLTAPPTAQKPTVQWSLA